MRDFHLTIRDLDKGKLSQEAGAQLRRVIAATQRTGLKGSLTVTLQVEPLEDREHVLLTAKVTAKAPAAETESTLFLICEDGDAEPVQQVLPFGDAQRPGN